MADGYVHDDWPQVPHFPIPFAGRDEPAVNAEVIHDVPCEEAVEAQEKHIVASEAFARIRDLVMRKALEARYCVEELIYDWSAEDVRHAAEQIAPDEECSASEPPPEEAKCTIGVVAPALSQAILQRVTKSAPLGCMQILRKSRARMPLSKLGMTKLSSTQELLMRRRQWLGRLLHQSSNSLMLQK